MKSLSIDRTTFSQLLVYARMKLIFLSHRASNSKANIPIWPKFELNRFYVSWLPAILKIRSKLKALSIGDGQIWASFLH